MLLAFNNSLDTNGATLSARVDATGTVKATGIAAPAFLLSPQTGASLQARPGRPGPDQRLDAALRRTEHTQLRSMIHGRGRAGTYDRLRAGALRVPGSPSAIKGVTGVPTVGQLITLNTNSADNQACSNPQNHTGRVVSISNASIILVDTGAPPNGFTEAEYTSFGVTFDTLIMPVDTTEFGAPVDIDNNGRVLIFFTQAVNQLTPAGASSVIGGFFHPRDLFPIVATGNFDACPTSNVGEMFYVPVVDPTSIYNAYFKSKPAMLTDMIGTLAHEFQHLINAGRRMYVNDADDFESGWLNEGLSHIAEELLYFRVSGFTAKSDLTLQQVTATPALLDAINGYQVDNLQRYSSYLTLPETGSPYKNDEDLATRGAIWSFLRFMADHATTPQTAYFHALVNAKTNGMANLQVIFANIFPGGIKEGFRSWALANFLDNTGIGADQNLTHPSWSFRNVLTNQIGNTGFPLKPRSLVDGGSQIFSLMGGGAGYMGFRVNAGATGALVPAQIPAAVDLVLVRIQ
jgi:hypothetical protein